MKNIKNILNNNKEIVLVVILFILVFVILLITGINNNYIKEGKLYINEIMSKNTYTYLDNEYYDYIEIYNGYSNDIDLSGYHLSDSEYETNRWTFPSIEIKAHEYLLVYASGKDTCDSDKRVCHTNFKLSSKGETITLTDSSGNILNKFTYPSLSNDLSYGYVNRKYTLLDKPTPGKENSEAYKYSKVNELFINEYMTSNKRSYSNSLGKYSDFVELYNNLDEDINIHNIYLSDDEENLIKYKLPDVAIKKKDYLLVYLTDISKVIDNEIFANFKLGDEDKYLIISNGKDIIDRVELVSLISDVSYGKVGDKWYYFTKPTPGKVNDTKPLEEIGKEVKE